MRRHLGLATIESPAWLLANNPDARAAEAFWKDEPNSRFPITTGCAFDTVSVPAMLGETVHARLSAIDYSYPAARCGDAVVFLVRQGSVWDGPDVPAALEPHARGERIGLPDPRNLAAWLYPATGRPPGFLLLVGEVREALWRSHWLHAGTERA